MFCCIPELFSAMIVSLLLYYTISTSSVYIQSKSIEQEQINDFSKMHENDYRIYNNQDVLKADGLIKKVVSTSDSITKKTEKVNKVIKNSNRIIKF